MSGLLTTLNSASSALNAQSQAIAVVSNNLANVNNANYSEETPDFSDLGMVKTAEGAESLGITVSVTQARSAVLDQMVRTEDSLTSGLTAQQSLFQQAQAALGENISGSSSANNSASTTTESGLSSSLDAFFNSFESLAANPTDEGAKETVVEQAGVLTDRFQEVDQNLAQVQSNADASVTAGVASANTLLQDVATLNSQIASFEVNDPGSAVDLRDLREGALEQLAALMPVSVQENAQGEDTVTAAASGGPVTLVSDGTVSNSLSYASGTISAGSTALGLSSSGSLAGSITASTGAVHSLRTNLDALANQIVTAVNAAYNPGNTTGGNFFDQQRHDGRHHRARQPPDQRVPPGGLRLGRRQLDRHRRGQRRQPEFLHQRGRRDRRHDRPVLQQQREQPRPGARHRQHPGHRPDERADDREQPALQRERRLARPGDVEPDDLPERLPGHLRTLFHHQYAARQHDHGPHRLLLIAPAMRITNNMVTNSVVAQLQQLDTQQSTLQAEVSSGLAVTQPSDNPGIFGQVIQEESQSNQLAQFNQNGTQAISVANASYAGLSSLTQIFDRATELATEGTSTLGASANAGYADEMTQLVQQAITVANSQSDGNYLFAGTAVSTKPFTTTTDSSGNITAVTYVGNSEQTAIPLSASSSVTPSTSGTTNSGMATMINNMIAVRNALTAGNSSALNTAADSLNDSEDVLSNAAADNGATQLGIQSQQTQQQSNAAEVANLISTQADANLPTVITKLDQAQLAYQAAMETAAKVMQLSLVDYIH